MTSNREKIITNMCYTWDHSYGVVKTETEMINEPLTSGMTQRDREFLWRQMAQIFDNDIAPQMEFKNDEK